MKRTGAFNSWQTWKVSAAIRAGLLFIMVSTSAAAADEGGLWTLWQRHSGEPENHEAALAACENFIKNHPSDSFAAVAQTIAAWHFLKTGRMEEARAALTPWLKDSADPVLAGARELARAWLTCMDIEQVRESLQQYYRREVRYPEKIADIAAHRGIPASQRPVMADRWGQAWTYQPADFKIMSGFRGQRCLVASRKLGDYSRLVAALKVPYADLIRIEPVRALAGPDGTPMVVQFRRLPAAGAKANEVLVIQQGAFTEGFYLAHAGPGLILVCDLLHWRAWKTPRR
ncbi:MAG: hypothetical protein PHP98_05295 [Kiritimatiellae bacterium]|nr:hypothetical protein [Kiritimatiellia bacterium]